MAVMTKRRENHVFERIVEFHKYAIMENSELKSSAELVRFAIKHGIVSE
jgi:DNA-binding NarL/FixJ family response regulator